MPPEKRIGIYHEPEHNPWGDRLVWFLLGGASLMIFRAIAEFFYAHH